jgi:hypothetical protein
MNEIAIQIEQLRLAFCIWDRFRKGNHLPGASYPSDASFLLDAAPPHWIRRRLDTRVLSELRFLPYTTDILFLLTFDVILKKRRSKEFRSAEGISTVS